ncbi:hypothetical protein pb186bvf_017052 [Paramecium bursaria]
MNQNLNNTDIEVQNGIEKFIDHMKSDPRKHLEVRIGQFIAKNPETVEDLQDYKDQFVILDNHIQKHHYRFEACISSEDFTNAKNNYNTQKDWVFVVDILFDVTVQTKRAYRFGISTGGQPFCFERKKVQEGKHLDIMDDSRMYRISLLTYENDENTKYEDLIKNLKQDYQDTNSISCVRIKETIIYEEWDYQNIAIYRVQQVDKKQKEFLHQIYVAITSGNTLKYNLEEVSKMMKAKSYYYKYQQSQQKTFIIFTQMRLENFMTLLDRFLLSPTLKV